MVRQAFARGNERNPLIVRQPRNDREDNLAWGMRAVEQMDTSGPAEWTYVTLLGGADTLAFRLRAAQSVLRPDMLPSFWSEAILVKLKGNSLRNAEATHVPLAQPEGPTYSPAENGVVSRPLEDFRDPERYPNIALIALPIAQEKIFRHIDAFKRSRSSLDALEHVVRWLAYCWGVARTPNPLHENYGIPSACMLETVCAAEEYDLTPGLESRASCPEAIWGAARRWHEYYEKTGGDREMKVPLGRFSTDHSYAIREDSGGVAGPSKRGGSTVRKSARPKATKKRS